MYLRELPVALPIFRELNNLPFSAPAKPVERNSLTQLIAESTAMIKGKQRDPLERPGSVPRRDIPTVRSAQTTTKRTLQELWRQNWVCLMAYIPFYTVYTPICSTLKWIRLFI